MYSPAIPNRLFVLSAIAVALGTLRVSSAIEREVAVDVRTVGPQAVTGRLVSFSLQDGATVQTGSEKLQIPVADIIRLSSTNRESPGDVVGMRLVTTPQDAAGGAAGFVNSDSWTITFTWGDVLCGREIRAQGDTLVLETADLGEVPVPIDAIARIESVRAASGVHLEALRWFDRVSAESARRSAVGGNRPGGGADTHESAFGGDEDRVLLTNGDVLRGFITAIDADGIAIDTETGPTTAPFRLVVAARLAHSPAPATPQPYAIITLADKSRLTTTGLEWADQGVEAKLRTGMRARIDADRVVAVDLIGGRWEWLSDPSGTKSLGPARGRGDDGMRTAGRHVPISYEQSSMLGPGWEYSVGRNVLNGPIIVAGKPYERGIGVHSRSNLIFELNGEYREFVTSFGMDDDSGPLADVTVVVLVEGQRRFEKAHVRRGSLFGPVRVDVSHAGRIELIVEYGDNGDMQDRLDWVEPGLIR